MKNLNLILLLAITFLLTNCEDPIDVPSPFEGPTVAVDAWLTNTTDVQTIVVNQSTDYFAGGRPGTISDAVVTVCRNGEEACFTFTESEPGNYQWTPAPGETLGNIGDAFSLTIELADQTLTASTVLNRTASLDSISLTFEEESIFFKEGFYAQVYARDQSGFGDSYWAKVWKNDTLLNRTFENTLSFDGAFEPGTDIDGLYFLPPLREINALDDEGTFIPYVQGDSVYVEVHSISNVAWQFMSIAFEQIENEGIFAVPIANAQGNISSSSEEKILGIFNVAQVASIGKRVE